MKLGDDPWRALRRYTSARIGLGRAGVSLPTTRALEFQAAHAAARTAVHEELDVASLTRALSPSFPIITAVETEAGDRATYLKRPDKGRAVKADALAALQRTPCDVAFVLADGLSARAVASHAVPLVNAILPRLHASGLTVGPLTIVRQGRVAAGDAIGAAIGARLVLLLIGERPGLSAADSLGVYLTYDPRPGRNDAQRNCISNVREGGLTIEAAAYRVHFLVTEALRRALSGVALKDETVEPEALGQTSTGFLLPRRREP